MDGSRVSPVSPLANDDMAVLTELERKILWLASWTIHNANHLRDSTDGLKVGGHQASSASLATIMTALYLATLRPQDRVAVKPHAAPVFHAIQYLLGQQTQAKLQAFRALGGAGSGVARAGGVGVCRLQRHHSAQGSGGEADGSAGCHCPTHGRDQSGGGGAGRDTVRI